MRRAQTYMLRSEASAEPISISISPVASWGAPAMLSSAAGAPPFTCPFRVSICSKSHLANSCDEGSSGDRLSRSRDSSSAIWSWVLPLTSMRMMYSARAESFSSPAHPASTSLGWMATLSASARGELRLISTGMMASSRRRGLITKGRGVCGTPETARSCCSWRVGTKGEGPDGLESRRCGKFDRQRCRSTVGAADRIRAIAKTGGRGI